MANYMAQGSVSVRRLRNGDNFFITLETTQPLYQGVDPDSGAVVPDWTQAANQPTVTPKVTSMMGQTVTLSDFAWSYNGNAIAFTGASSGGWTTSADGKFQLNTTTGALKIVRNLASATNTAGDTLEFSCTATVEGVEYQLRKSAEVVIQRVGASSYLCMVQATTRQLTSEVPTATLTTELWASGGEVSEYHVRWYKDDTEWAAKAGQKSVEVTREDVGGQQLFIAEFRKSAGDSAVLGRAAVAIIDTLDEFVLVGAITSAQTMVEENKPVTVKFTVINRTTNAQQDVTGATWRTDVMDPQTWTVLKTAAADTIQVTTAETDYVEAGAKKIRDVEVVGEVTWNA